MNYIILIIVLVSLILLLKSVHTIVKASKRINLLYEYFIIKQNTLDEGSISNLAKRPNPNDGSGCPKESELLDD